MATLRPRLTPFLRAGTINRMGKDIEYLLSVDNIAVKDLLLCSISARTAEILTGVKSGKGYIGPAAEMLALLARSP